MQVTVFGASGKVGSLVVERLLADGHNVVAFTHSRQLFATNNRMGIAQGDIHDAATVLKALKGSDSVISCLGSWGTKSKDILTAGMKVIIPAMEKQGIKRIVTLTGSGAYAPTDRVRTAHKLLFYFTAPYPAGKVFRDGEEHMKLLAESNLDWTTIRSPIMNNFGKSTYALGLKAGSPLTTIKRQAVADALVDQLALTDYLAQAPIIRRR